MTYKIPKEQIDKLKESIKHDIIIELETRKVKLDSNELDFIVNYVKSKVEFKLDSQEIVLGLLDKILTDEQQKRIDFYRQEVFTPGIKSEFIKEILDQIELPKDGEKGEQGEKGEPGKNADPYQLTDEDKRAIAGLVDVSSLVKDRKRDLAQVVKDIKTGKLKPPSAGIDVKEIISEISKILGTDLWTGPTQVLIDQVIRSLSTGLIYGMKISINADTSKFDISSGEGYWVDNTSIPDTPVVVKVDYAESIGNTVTNIATQLVTYISINSSGEIVQEQEIPDAEDRRQRIFLGVLVHTNHSTIEAVNNIPTVMVDTDAQLQDLMNYLGLFNIEGNSIRSYNGSLEITKTAGSIFKVGGNFQENPNIPHLIELAAQNPVTNIQYRTQTGATYNPSGLIDAAYYDVAGTRTALSNTIKASNHRVYIFPSGLIRIQYGQKEYANLSAAVEGLSTEIHIVETNLKQNGLLLCTIAVRAGATNLALATDAVFLPAGKWGDVSNTGSTAVGTLQQIYNNSVTKPQIVVTSDLGAVEISDENSLGNDVARFGKISDGNYTALEADGTIRFVGNATVWEDVNIGGVALRAGTSNQPSLTNLDTTTILVWGFSASQTNEVHGNFEIPHAYKEGTDIIPHVHWYPTTTGTNNVLWRLEYYIRAGNTLKLTGTIDALAPGNGVAWEEIRSNFPTIAGTDLKIGSQFHARLARIGGDVTDTYAAVACIATFGIHYQADTAGSRLVTSK